MSCLPLPQLLQFLYHLVSLDVAAARGVIEPCPHPDAPWDCHICRSGQGWCQRGQLIGIYGSPTGRVWASSAHRSELLSAPRSPAPPRQGAAPAWRRPGARPRRPPRRPQQRPQRRRRRGLRGEVYELFYNCFFLQVNDS